MDAASPDSVSRWILEAKAGDTAAVAALWGAYFERLVVFARRKLADSPCRIADEEDLALSAFASFCDAARQGRFPNLADRDDLWKLLVTMTAQKAVDRLRHDRRVKRGGGRVRGESAFAAGQSDESGPGMNHVIGHEPTPEFAAMVAEELARLLDSLEKHLRPVALAKMEGFSNAEIAQRLDCSLSTVERSLRLVRKIWQRAMDASH